MAFVSYRQSLSDEVDVASSPPRSVYTTTTLLLSAFPNELHPPQLGFFLLCELRRQLRISSLTLLVSSLMMHMNRSVCASSRMQSRIKWRNSFSIGGVLSYLLSIVSYILSINDMAQYLSRTGRWAFFICFLLSTAAVWKDTWTVPNKMCGTIKAISLQQAKRGIRQVLTTSADTILFLRRIWSTRLCKDNQISYHISFRN